ncbi:uncharacterized protein PHACADRAFT_203180 [Phanerochaete carnosa HHB-10118-sp]|uniref:Uncharacterized protein n=1 Tax=Phanerochaete carnosa (strain HHB-10118-sp) TaxID=650164 RepID=K5UFB7_PHACS|nr:uncharacterized protein PHACADRAFT_203180 [Phanerochaete carnosa HHB-10118-sp]EKM48146.1 hypothetical protein PHACADRAFT_203180 [Phanerochaete carnosa HHB-10118-sp]
MANPMVRPLLHLYPEKSAPHLSEARQADRWLSEVEPKYAGIMARDAEGQQDYYIHEPCLADLDGTGKPAIVMPVRFFMKNGSMHAQAHCMTVLEDGFVIEAGRKRDCRDVPLSALKLSFPRLLESFALYKLPSPDQIIGVRRHKCSCQRSQTTSSSRPCRHIEKWEHPPLNAWRAKAQGRPVLPLLLWMYCDDTSGNGSKKWNKYNSFLFVLAGLPREHVHLPYNIHSLSTSNVAAPLEMLEGISADLRELQDHGLVAWDCVFNEEVIYVPWPFAFLGDNPMQSELASHVGMTGKFFCRVCTGGEKDTSRGPTSAQEQHRLLSAFLTLGTPRTREHTIAELWKQWDCVESGRPSHVDATATQSGAKDKHLTAFLEQLTAELAKLKTQNQDEGRPASAGFRELLDRLLDGRAPEDILNPIFTLDDIDPNADTPVEILHVVLLGFAKYFWRDAVPRQSAAGKQTLKARLSSLNVSGLGLFDLQGSTFVQYAKSLTGRDFRVILQVAPAVLYDLVPPEAYEAWLALCPLCPLVFQPEIRELDSYLVMLQEAIDDFLAATALWTTQWFNKPKFHLLLHLVLHIRCFGPAILMATEGFESYNYVIRSRSILSNRHAPSKDIAHSMSFTHAVRHLVSGGFVTTQEGLRRQAGMCVQALAHDQIFLQLMGMAHLDAASDSKLSCTS